MKAHTSDLKNNIKKIGRVLDSKITYTLDNEEIVLGMTDLNSVTPSYTTSLLKSVMKQLDIDSNVEIPEGTVINYQLGVLVNGSFEYLNYGNYVVYKVEKQEDVRSYKITCYDKMLYAMKDYEAMNITYPITIRDYIGAIATHLGLTFANTSDTFANYNREIASELYLDSEGNSLGYTFRDVLDELAQATASNICINEETDELEVRYIKDATINEIVKGSSLEITDSEKASLVNFELEGNTTQETRSGKNLIHINSGTQTKNGVTITNNNDGTITVNGTCTAAVDIWFANGTNYLATNYAKSFASGDKLTLRKNIVSGTSTGNWSIRTILYNTSTQQANWNLLANDMTYTATFNGETRGVELLANTGDTFNNLVLFPQLEFGENATTPEQYGAMPSPDYPSELVSVGYKNYFEAEYLQTTANTNINANLYKNTYTLSLETKQNFGGVIYIQLYKNNTLITTNGHLLNTSSAVSFSTSSYWYYFPNIPNGNKLTFTLDDDYSLKIALANATGSQKALLVKGTQEHSYIPYGKYGIEIKTTNDNNEDTYTYVLNQPLRGIGDTKDLLYIKNGILYVDRKIGSKILNGSEDWAVSGGTTNVFQLVNAFPYQYQNSLSNYFVSVVNANITANNNAGNLMSDNTISFRMGNTKDRLYLKSTQFNNNLSALKSWLSTHNTEVQYILAETYVEIVGDADMPSTYEGTTYITTTDEIEPSMNIEYIKEYDKINEEFFKDINVTFKEKYGPVNSIVLSRAGGSDNVYLQDETSVGENGLCEIKISDNQIMNWNDRSDYLPSILGRLNGLEYYLNDYSSTGIFYYNVCDKYNASIDGNSYSCVMFNDEINITQGAEENIYTDMPEETETDYTKSDKTDRRINQTYIMVDKQNGRIDALADSIQDLTEFIKTVEGINIITLNNTMASNGAIGRLEITGFTEMGLYPGMTYPNNNTYANKLTSYIIVQENEDGTEQNETFISLSFPLVSTDKLIIDNNKVFIERTNEKISTNLDAVLKTFDGKTKIYLKFFDSANIKCQYLEKNNFTRYFATQAELSSLVTVTDELITSKVSKAELVSEINQSAEQITLKSNRLVVESDGFTLDGEGNMTATSGEIGGFNLNSTNFSSNINGIYNYDILEVPTAFAARRGQIELDSSLIQIYDARNDGNIDTGDVAKILRIAQGRTESDKVVRGKFLINSEDPKNCVQVQDEYGNIACSIGVGGVSSKIFVGKSLAIGNENGDTTLVAANGNDGSLYCVTLTQTSKEETKKNFEKLKNAKEILKSTDIYKYNFKHEEDTDKKHIGFVIGNNYNYSKEITSKKNDGAEIYSMVSVLWQVVKEQQEEIDKLKEMINNA